MRKYLFIALITVLSLWGCANRQNLKTERKQIDSLYLVISIPVVVIDSLSRKEDSLLVGFFSQELMSKGFSLITVKDAQKLIRDDMKNSKVFSTNPEDMKKTMARISQNPSYLSDELRRAKSFLQTIKILPCYPSQPGCIEVKRNNHPYAAKIRKWVFNKEEGMTDEAFVSSIISALQPPTPK